MGFVVVCCGWVRGVLGVSFCLTFGTVLLCCGGLVPFPAVVSSSVGLFGYTNVPREVARAALCEGLGEEHVLQKVLEAVPACLCVVGYVYGAWKGGVGETSRAMACGTTTTTGTASHTNTSKGGSTHTKPVADVTIAVSEKTEMRLASVPLSPAPPRRSSARGSTPPAALSKAGPTLPSTTAFHTCVR